MLLADARQTCVTTASAVQSSFGHGVEMIETPARVAEVWSKKLSRSQSGSCLGIPKISFRHKDSYYGGPTSLPALERSSFKIGDLFALWYAMIRSRVGTSPFTGRVVIDPGRYRFV